MNLIKKEVDMGDADFGERNNLLYTKKLGTCMGLVIHDKQNLRGFLMHCPGSEELALEWIAQSANIIEQRPEFSDDLSYFFVSSMITRDPRTIKLIEDNRKIAMDALIKAAQGRPVDHYYSKSMYGVGVLLYRPLDGKIKMKHFKIDEMFLDMFDD